MSDLSNTNAPLAVNGAKTRTYRGWLIDCDPKPIPVRNCDWTATHPDYDASYEGPEDGWVGSHPILYAATEKDLMVEIDCWHMDEEEAA